jgi:predicted acylesterase/phospholipase RssA
MSLPGITPPVEIDGRLHVDGGLLDNLPVEVMSLTGEGPVIALDVTVHSELPQQQEQRQRHWRFGKHTVSWNEGIEPPGLQETLARAFQLKATDSEIAAERHADFVIKMPRPEIGLSEFHQIDRLIEFGRGVARDALNDAPDELFH